MAHIDLINNELTQNINSSSHPTIDNNKHLIHTFAVKQISPTLNDNNSSQSSIDSIATPQTDNTYIIPSLTYSSIPHYMDKSVIFIGMINNAEKTLSHILEQLNEVTCLFNNTFFLFFESNSNDNTTKILESWSMNDTLQSNHGDKVEYCYNLDNTMSRYPNIIYKKILYGDKYVQTELDEYIQYKSNDSYIHSLSRIEKFVPYRNMLLKQLYALDIGDIGIDYIFMIDLDVWEIDFSAFLRELHDCPYHIMCINGVEWYNYYRDSFASVEMNHNWIHRPYIKASKKRYDRLANGLRQIMPRTGERYERMQSCFNGLTAYKMSPNKMKEIDCKYLLNDDVQQLYKNDNSTDDDLKWLYEVNRIIRWSDSKGVMFDIESGYETNLCEHIAFSYCLNFRAGTSMAIARDAKLYYFPLVQKKGSSDNPRKKRRRQKAAKREYNPISIV